MELLSPIMAPNKKRNAGRQLLILRNRMKAPENTSKIASLRRKEANLLLELGQRDEAIAVATSLTEADSGDGSELAFLADILAGASKWRLAEENFAAARLLCLKSGREEKAFALAAGPLFLLAEARKDYDSCLRIAPSDLLRNRALRLSEQIPVGVIPPEASPWRELYLLEQVHSGGDPSLLSGILDNWKSGEAEWRWRILYEGASLEQRSGLPGKQWSIYLRETGRKVLDPRYPSERKALKRMLQGGFVKNFPS